MHTSLHVGASRRVKRDRPMLLLKYKIIVLNYQYNFFKLSFKAIFFSSTLVLNREASEEQKIVDKGYAERENLYASRITLVIKIYLTLVDKGERVCMSSFVDLCSENLFPSKD